MADTTKGSKKKREKRGIHIMTLTVIMLVMITASCAIMFVSNYNLKKQYADVIASDDAYKNTQHQSQILEDSIAYMSEQLQNFVITGNATYMNNYFNEVNSPSRQNAIDKIGATDEEKKQIKGIQVRLDSLVLRDTHIMKLVSRAHNIYGGSLPDEIVNTPLSDEERKMSPSQWQSLAENLITAQDYQDMKNRINSDIDRFLNRILARQNQKMLDEEKSLEQRIQYQQILCCIVTGVIFIACAFLYLQVIRILKAYSVNILRNKPLNRKGVYELRSLADAYNENWEAKEQKEKKLQKMANHDALTGIFNRGAFEKSVSERLLTAEQDTGLFLLIDVDKFKLVNDNYGHDMGDKVLKLVATTLCEHFRNEDVVGRFGGDEFAIWIPSLPKEHIRYIKERIQDINGYLTTLEKPYPQFSLSVGIAFSQRGDSFHQVYTRADQALYIVKEHGRCGCRVYGEE